MENVVLTQEHIDSEISPEEASSPSSNKPGLLHEYFEYQSDQSPENPAIFFEDLTLTYSEVEALANQLAHYLKELEVGPERMVGVLLERSEKPIIASLGILKTGAGYVPIDSSAPGERVSYITKNSNIKTIITESSLAHRLEENFNGNLVVLDTQNEIFSHYSIERQPREVCASKPEDVCYVIYTSGTTGKPKGVVTEHRNACSFIDSFSEVCSLTSRDRVYQGFSLSFDGSVEEIWMAFSAGASLIVASNEKCKIGSEVAGLINENEVTFFSTVPTLLTLINEDLPTVKTLILSGEVCPPELVSRWAAKGRRVLNVYGPTEATVNTTVAECSPDKPITIGKPIKNYDVHILNQKLEPVEAGQIGELYIGGPGLARGYLNQPELTDKHFIYLEANGVIPKNRLYKTGDLAKFNDDGNLLFLGRIDSQIKIRGFRIELAEIESVLREHAEILSAAVKVINKDGMKQLAAFVVRKNSRRNIDRDSILDLLQSRIPSYMVPTYLDVIERIPLLHSGKVARDSLPPATTPLLNTSRKLIEPSNELESRIVAIWEDIFSVRPISVEDNFFDDLGGDSLLAALTATELREKLGLEVAIRDIYNNATSRKLAENLILHKSQRTAKTDATTEANTEAEEVFQSVSPLTRSLCYSLQAISLMFFYGIGVISVYVYLFLGLSFYRDELNLIETLVLGGIATFAISFGLMVLAILSKWILIGRFKPGSYPLWSIFYFRWWFVDKMHSFSGINMFAGTPIVNLYLRLMGARIGNGVILDSVLCSAFDLIAIGDNSCIGSETQFLGYRVEKGKLVLGNVNVGRNCFVGIHSCLGLNTRMGENSALGDLSMLPDNATIETEEKRKGSPSTKTNLELPKTEDYKRRPVLYSLAHLASLFLVTLSIGSMFIPIIILLKSCFKFGGTALGIFSVYLSVPLTVITFCASVAIIKNLLIKDVTPGVYPVESNFYLRKWLVDCLMRMSVKTMKPLYTTIYLPPWLRLLGASIGKRAEISTVSQISPELITIDDESFFADGSIIGGRHFYSGHVELSKSYIGKRSFIGNSAILPIGSNIGHNCLLGCLSCPPESQKKIIPDNTEWLGSPSFRLPFRNKVAGFSERLTFKPTKKLYAQRSIIDGLRILIPGIILTTGIFGLAVIVYSQWKSQNLQLTLMLAPLYGVFLTLFATLTVAILKKIVMGTFEPVIKPLWSVYVWLNEMVNGAYESVFAPAVTPLLGTPFFAPLLRTMGCKVGKRTVIETTLFSEFDLVQIGDYSSINKGAIIQNHLFEDRIMKSDYLSIGKGCSIGNMSVILYSSKMGDGSSIGPLSLLMKGETIPRGSKWQGIPTEGC